MTETMSETTPEMMMTEPEKRKRGRPSKTNGQSPDIGFSESSADKPKQTRGIERQITEIEIGLLGLFKASGGVVGYFDQFDGAIISGESPLSTMPLFVEAVCRAARTDGRLRGWLLSIVHVSAYSDIALYGAMMLVPILLHHNIIPQSLFTNAYADTNTEN
jgi:hypothetical protein